VKKVCKVIRRVVEEQYELMQDLGERFFQLPKQKRVLLIDNLDQAVHVDYCQKLLANVSKEFGCIVAVADTSLLVHQSLKSADTATSSECLHFSLMPFGRELRAQLIKKWFSIGSTPDGESDDNERKLKSAERLATEVIGKQQTPLTPFVCLTILSTNKTREITDFGFGSLSYYFEALIDVALGSVYLNTDLTTVHAFLSELAAEMFQRRRRFLSATEVGSVFQNYKEKYEQTFDWEGLVDSLVKANILKRLDGRFGFERAYQYHFFFAHYIRHCLVSRLDIE